MRPVPGAWQDGFGGGLCRGGACILKVSVKMCE